jgi:hypothetical protein
MFLFFLSQVILFHDRVSRNWYKVQSRRIIAGLPVPRTPTHTHTYMFRTTRKLFQARKPTMTAFNVEIVSDPVCPFCFLGKKRLDRAIEVYKKTIPSGSEDVFNITCKLLAALGPPILRVLRTVSLLGFALLAASVNMRAESIMGRGRRRIAGNGYKRRCQRSQRRIPLTRRSGKPFYLDPTLPQGKSMPVQERM